jgi:hypothetical protein
MQHTSKEWVKVWHDPVLQGLELHHATFSTQSHFTHRFKRLLGITPGQYVSSAQETRRQRRSF